MRIFRKYIKFAIQGFSAQWQVACTLNFVICLNHFILLTCSFWIPGSPDGVLSNRPCPSNVRPWSVRGPFAVCL